MNQPLPEMSPGYRTKKEYVYQFLRDSIMRCDIAPGEKIIIKEVTENLSVSSIPVREALQLLHSEDLVEHRSHVGTIASQISKESILESFTLKEGLEVAAIRVAVLKVSDQQIVELENQLKEMDAVIKSENYEGWGRLNRQFHSTIVSLTAMPMLMETFSKVLDRWDRIRRYFFSTVLVDRLAQSQEEHYSILQALKDGNGEKAEQITSKHNRSALSDYMAHIEVVQKVTK